MANILGLSFFFHDSAAAMVCDGRIVAAAAEERFCRRKHTNEFPKRAIEYCLGEADLKSLSELDAVVFYEKPVLKLFRVVETLAAGWPRGWASATRLLPAFLTDKVNVLRTIAKALPGYDGPIYFTKHHLSHAASAFYCSPFEHAAILTLDGVGEQETTTIGEGRGSDIEIFQSVRFPHSIGLLYSALTGYLGFRVNDDEWKVMGLAPFGRPTYAQQFQGLVRTGSDGCFELDMDYFAHHYSAEWIAHNRRWEALFGFPRRRPGEPLEQRHQDLAHSGQQVVEERILALAREAGRLTGAENLVMAGGVALNGVANSRVEREGGFRNVWIQPAAGDDGGALGAALATARLVFDDSRCAPMTHAYLGPEYSESSIRAFLDSRSIAYQSLDGDDQIEATADLIAADKVIGWFQGRMEFGPRALGARSILANPANPDMKDRVNHKIKFREAFRPFAPAVPLDRVHEYFDVAPGTELPFMLKVPQVRPDMRDAIPAVTHVDGSSRVQTVTAEDNPLFHRLLLAVGRRTGVPIVLNTSFNVRGEPIVCSPEDAYHCFLNSGLDALVMGHALVTEKPLVESASGAEHEGAHAEAPAGRRAKVAHPQPYFAAEAPATSESVLHFYRELPFNYYSNAVDTARQLLRSNRIRSYPSLHRHLRAAPSSLRILDVGCGAGWFVNSCAHYYGADAVGLDFNAVVLDQARSVARLVPGCDRTAFVEADLFAYRPEAPFDVVNSLGVLHSTHDCHAAIRQALRWIRPDGYLHLGLYHLYGRRPFLEHFARMEAEGASDDELYEAFRLLCPDITDETHLRSWYRDQVIHPHETQHTFEEIHQVLADEGFEVEATSINRFKPMPPMERLVQMERQCEARSRKAIEKQGRYFPGFFVVWARRRSKID